MSTIGRLGTAGKIFLSFLTALIVSLSAITLHHQTALSLGGGWGDPLDPLPFVSAGFKSNNCGIPGYGDYVPGRYHLGTDLAGFAGQPVLAIADGRVMDVQFDWPGAAVFIRHTAADGTRFLAVYGHMAGAIPIGTVVAKGQQVGVILNQGPNTHLHMGIRTILAVAPSNNGAAACFQWPEANGYVDLLTFVNDHPLAPPPPPPPPAPKPQPTPSPPPPSTPAPQPKPAPPPPPKETVLNTVRCQEAINRPNTSIAIQLGIVPRCGTSSL